MPTSKPLRELVPRIMQHINLHKEFLAYDNRVFLVYEGQLRHEIEKSLASELSPNAYKKAIQRIPSINFLQRIIDKISRVYSDTVQRTAAKTSDQALIAWYENEADINKQLAAANRIYNLHKRVALEPFLEGDCPKLRIIPGHQFLPFSDNEINPQQMTVFIKFMGECHPVAVFTDINGRKVQRDETRLVQKYYLYSDDEFLIIDSDGACRDDLMIERESDGTNGLGVIPFVYVNKSEFRLVPLPDSDTLDNTILIPKLLADLNYAVQFQSHSIFVTTDIDLPDDMKMNPDSVWDLKSSEGAEGKQGRVDVLKPTVDIDKVLELIRTTLAMWLEAKNIKAGEMGTQRVGDAASGAARMVDEADTTQDRQIQAQMFEVAERDLWELLAVMHNYWVDAGLIEDQTAKFSADFDVAVEFGDQKPIESDDAKIKNAVQWIQAGLMTKRQAIRELKPTFTDEQVDEWVAQLAAEAPDVSSGQPSGTATQDPRQDKGQGNPRPVG